jgi:hypothetical protein
VLREQIEYTRQAEKEMQISRQLNMKINKTNTLVHCGYDFTNLNNYTKNDGSIS